MDKLSNNEDTASRESPEKQQQDPGHGPLGEKGGHGLRRPPPRKGFDPIASRAPRPASSTGGTTGLAVPVPTPVPRVRGRPLESRRPTGKGCPSGPVGSRRAGGGGAGALSALARHLFHPGPGGREAEAAPHLELGRRHWDTPSPPSPASNENLLPRTFSKLGFSFLRSRLPPYPRPQVSYGKDPVTFPSRRRRHLLSHPPLSRAAQKAGLSA